VLDEEVRMMGPAGFDDEVLVAPRGVPSGGRLTMPADARGIVLSSGIGDDARRRVIGRELASGHLATLRFALLSDEELRDDHRAADVELLAVRFLAVTRWIRGLSVCAGLPIGYFGTGGAGAAALWAASEDAEIGAVVSRDSRLEVVRPRLPAVFAPTLLVVGIVDPALRVQHEQSGRRLRCEHRVAVLEEDPRHAHDTFDSGDRLACQWFVDHLVAAPAPGASAG
jgi:putative phosphoribosyl transferase